MSARRCRPDSLRRAKRGCGRCRPGTCPHRFMGQMAPTIVGKSSNRHVSSSGDRASLRRIERDPTFFDGARGRRSDRPFGWDGEDHSSDASIIDGNEDPGAPGLGRHELKQHCRPANIYGRHRRDPASIVRRCKIRRHPRLGSALSRLLRRDSRIPNRGAWSTLVSTYVDGLYPMDVAAWPTSTHATWMKRRSRLRGGPGALAQSVVSRPRHIPCHIGTASGRSRHRSTSNSRMFQRGEEVRSGPKSCARPGRFGTEQLQRRAGNPPDTLGKRLPIPPRPNNLSSKGVMMRRVERA